MISNCLIVGSGICGLTAANILRDNDISVTVLDKGRGIGGRIATRKFSHEMTGEGVFDYGAQYFTARDERFKKWVEKWIKLGIVNKWSEGFVNSKGDLKIDNQNRYIGSENMRQITKFMAQDLDLHQSTKVTKFNWEEDKWLVLTEDEKTYYSKNLLLTSPVPQSLALIRESNISLDQDLRTNLENIEYDPCIVLMALCESETNIPKPGGMWVDDEHISWISDNYKKGIKTEAISVTVHTSPTFSRNNWNESNESIYNKLSGEILELTGTEVVGYQIHKWLYSQPVTFFDSYFAFTNKSGPIYFAGDAFSGPRVEGAFISGLEAGNEIVRKIQS